MEQSLKARLAAVSERIKAIDEQLGSESVMNDFRQSVQLSKERAELSPVHELYVKYTAFEKQLEEAAVMKEDEDEEISSMGKDEYIRLEAELERIVGEIKILLVPHDPNDDKNIVVEIRGAAGGDEANIFAGDLFRMYTKFAENNGWRIQMLDQYPSEAGGYSQVSFMIKGKNVYSKLKFESGAHRVQRVPKTEASGRVHTSTATVLVMPEAEEVDIVINPSDLHIDTMRSGGAGGQNVNKVESAVRITHIPTGIVAYSQMEKSQLQNRELAMGMLRARLYAYEEQKQQEKIGNERKLKVGTGERSEKVRTYNYPQNRVTDHRIGYTVQKLDRVMEGDLDDIIEALINYDQESRLTDY